MKKCFSIIVAATLAISNSFATPVNITIADGQAGNGATAPWNGTPGLGAGNEDNETEPRTITGDQWDVEAFGYDQSSSVLSLIGTYDFKNGETHNNINYSSGAIFIRATGNASWNYAYVLNFVNNTYQLFDSFSTLAPSDIPASTPWTVDLNKPANQIGAGSFGYTTGIVDPLGFGLQRQSGSGHNEIDLGLNLLPSVILNSFDVHFTISCGNDDAEGSFVSRSVPDHGMTATLFALSMGGLILMRIRNHAPALVPVRVKTRNSISRRI